VFVAVVRVRVRMMQVAVVVAMLWIVGVFVSVGVVVHPVHRPHFTRLRQLAQPFALSGKFDTSPARIH
jgi:hypothetical protein